MGSQLSTYFEGTLPTGTLAYYIFNNHHPSSFTFLTKWTDLAKGNLDYQWLLRGSCEHLKITFLKTELRTSLVAQWLRLRLPMQGMWVRSLVGELRSHMPHSQKTKT